MHQTFFFEKREMHKNCRKKFTSTHFINLYSIMVHYSKVVMLWRGGEKKCRNINSKLTSNELFTFFTSDVLNADQKTLMELESEMPTVATSNEVSLTHLNVMTGVDDGTKVTLEAESHEYLSLFNYQTIFCKLRSFSPPKSVTIITFRH